MSVFIATGTNLGDRKQNLDQARAFLCTHFKPIAASRIYESPAVDYLNQPDFYNQVLEFETPQKSPLEIMRLLLKIELEMGRNRQIPKGPRLIDLDLLFCGTQKIDDPDLILPHPRLFERSFVVLPLSELPGFINLQKSFCFSFSFDNTAKAIS
jgi:2-amino-4-hydroxy-6-hydroxymethyldihydropteridine diphosphokinase